MSALNDLLFSAAKARRIQPHEIDVEQLVAGLDDATVQLLFALTEQEQEAIRFGRFAALFPDEGPLRRELYTKHLEFFRAGGQGFTERLFMAGNRVGKTIAGGYEVTCHLTGEYPHWWEGHRFHRPTRGWVAGDTNETTRDILQLELLGEVGFRENRKIMDGSGLIPRKLLGVPTWKSGVANLVDTIRVKHRSGGWSMLGLKSYEQGRKVFQGTAKHFIWLDEEVPIEVYGECQMRLMTTKGLLMTTFTPLRGLTEMVEAFLPSDLHSR